MTDQNQMVGDQPVDTSVTDTGDSQQNANNRDVVKYDTYQRVLSEKKRAAEEAARLRKELDERIALENEAKEKALKENQQWKELYESEQEKAKQAAQRASELEQRQLEARKLNAILNSLPGTVPSKFWSLIDTSAVLYDQESDAINEDSVKKVCDMFTKEYSQCFEKPSASSTDSSAPRANGSGKLSHDEWLKLPVVERKQRAGDVEGIPDWMVNGGAGQYLGKN